jgi:hypothetical protein
MKLKEQYKNLKITITHPKYGELVFDSNINNEGEYPFFYENGFSHLFEIIKPIPYKGVTNQKKK